MILNASSVDLPSRNELDYDAGDDPHSVTQPDEVFLSAALECEPTCSELILTAGPRTPDSVHYVSVLARLTPNKYFIISYDTNRMLFCGTTLSVLAAQPL